MTTAAEKVEEASEKIREILHSDQIESMTAPELCQFIAETNLLLWMMGAVAEFEPAYILERQAEGVTALYKYLRQGVQ